MNSLRDKAVVFSFEALTQRIIGVFYEVYNELGYGFAEAVYQRSLSCVEAGRIQCRG